MVLLWFMFYGICFNLKLSCTVCNSKQVLAFNNVIVHIKQKFYLYKENIKAVIIELYYSLQKSNLLQIQHEGLHALFLGPDRVSVYDCHYHHHNHRSTVPKSLLHCQLFLYEHLLQHNFEHHQQHR